MNFQIKMHMIDEVTAETRSVWAQWPRWTEQNITGLHKTEQGMATTNTNKHTDKQSQYRPDYDKDA